MTNPRTISCPLRRVFSRTPTRRAFTLVELLIVIGLILMLVAITVTVSIGVLRQSEVRESRNVITILDNALQEWTLQATGDLTYGINNQPCGGEVYRLPQRAQTPDAYQGANGATQALEDARLETDILIATLLSRPLFEDMIASIDARFIERIEVQDNPDMAHVTVVQGLENIEYIYRFMDAWENPILAVHPGRTFNSRCTGSPDGGTTGYLRDEDGTIRTPLENVFGVSESRRIYFVSAGPSERFGHLYLHKRQVDLDDVERQQTERAGDNIYSYPVIIEQARPQP
jgi:prepilin-type N-terminal cleavage/methylation domain-containing protein